MLPQHGVSVAGGGALCRVSLGQAAMQKRGHQSFAISTGCYLLAQMVHIIDYPVTAAAALLLVIPGGEGGRARPEGGHPDISRSSAGAHKVCRLTEITNERINLRYPATSSFIPGPQQTLEEQQGEAVICRCGADGSIRALGILLFPSSAISFSSSSVPSHTGGELIVQLGWWLEGAEQRN